jgi:hypothetical protein
MSALEAGAGGEPVAPRRRFANVWLDGATLLLAGALTVGATGGVLMGYGLWVLAGAAVAGLVWLFAIDVAWLPAVALVGFALLPTDYVTSVNTRHGAYNLALGVVLVLVLRIAAAGQRLRPGPHVIAVLLLSVWVVIETVVSQFRSTSEAWTLDFLVLVAAPALILPGWKVAQQRVERTWLVLGGLLGAYGLIELVLAHNPIYGSLYASGGYVATPGSGYRITTTLGDPLVNGVFFAVATLLGAGRLLERPQRWEWAATVLAAAGMIATGSRGAALALAIGLVIVLVVRLNPFNPAVTRRKLLGAFAVVAVLAAVGGVYVGRRAGSVEAAASTATRLATYQVGGNLLTRYWPLGAGPGVTDELAMSMPVGEFQRGVESSAYEIAIELGLPGTILVCGLLLAVCFSSIRRRPELAAAIIAFYVASATFNLLDESRAAMVMWGLLIGVGIRPAPQEPALERAPAPAPGALS